MKKQERPPLSLEQVDKTAWEDSAFVQWLSQYGSYAAWGALAAIALLILVYRLLSGGYEKAEREYLEADRAFQIFTQNSQGNADPLTTKEALKNLHAILQRHPELHAKYDGLIAQTLINRGEVDSAIGYTNLALARTDSESSPFYRDYSQTTLLIGERHYRDALKDALNLQQKMSEQLQVKEHLFGDVLFAFNLLRIAALQQELDQKEAELASWEQWKEFVSKSNDSALAQIMETLTVGNIALKDYIETRKAILKQ